MSSRVDAVTMTRAMGMGMKTLDLLQKKIKEHGGGDHILPFMTRPRFKKNMDTIAKLIVACDWRIPASEMRKLAGETAEKEFENPTSEEIEVDRNLWWLPIVCKLGIPFEQFSGGSDESYPRLSERIRQDLDGKIMTYPLLCTYAGDEYVVIEFLCIDGWPPKPGETICAEKIEQLSIAKTKYFDFES